MILLPASIAAWDGPDFKATLKRELEALPPGQLPLQQLLSQTSHALDEPITAIVLDAHATAGRIHAKVGVFCLGLVPGCSCADDPSPIEPQQEYGELRLEIEPLTGLATVRVATED